MSATFKNVRESVPNKWHVKEVDVKHCVLSFFVTFFALLSFTWMGSSSCPWPRAQLEVKI